MVDWQFRPEDYRRTLDEQNPWHQSGTVPEALAPPTERSLAPVLWERLVHNEPRRHQVILGPRRVGKTTVLYQTVRHLMGAGIASDQIWWLRMDHPLLLQFNLGDLVRYLIIAQEASHDAPVYLMLDEIVYSGDWDLWLKTFHDENWPVRIAATSSSTTVLRKQRPESGVGRWEEHHLLPCRLEEFLSLAAVPLEPRPGDTPSRSQTSPDQVEDETFRPGDTLAETLDSLRAGSRAARQLETYRTLLMFIGGFPELLTRITSRDDPDPDLANQVLESQRVLRGDVVERCVYKDIPQASQVENPLMLERLLYVLAGQVTGILSPQKLSQELGIAQPTLDRYLSYLEQAYLVFTLTNYSGAEPSVQRRGRKLYFTDGAVRNAALHRGVAPLSDPDERGELLENLAAASLNTLAVHAGVRLHHWRDGNHEVDLIYDDPRAPLAFEIASSPNHSRRGLSALIGRYPSFRGNSYLVAPQSAVFHAREAESGIGSLPLDTFLLATGTQAHQAMLTRLGVHPSPPARPRGPGKPIAVS
ncbi:ATP-binding protein [Candidatus Poriferisocius sp.]|uniref:ATP-binding protein n=1 Tax=Candidatus Poriferisocius sp. TaxID=3101276 RepID=UPI003B023BD4